MEKFPYESEEDNLPCSQHFRQEKYKWLSWNVKPEFVSFKYCDNCEEKSNRLFQLSISVTEIKKMSKNQFSQIIKKAIQERALEYLADKQGSKGNKLQRNENGRLPLA